MVKYCLTMCMIFLLPAVIIQLLMSALLETEFDWGYFFIMTMFCLVAAIVLTSAHDMKERKKTEVQLNYTASVPSAPMNVLLIMLVLNTSISVEGMQNWALFIRIAVSIAVVLLALLRFKLYIEESKLTYEITLYKLSLYKRRIAPNQIKNIKFIRVGWAQKAAIIQVKKGFNIRVINFKPTVYPKLIAFAKKHSISITKTNEYLLLEKASRQTPIQQEEKV